jgi:hypothetical protein
LDAKQGALDETIRREYPIAEVLLRGSTRRQLPPRSMQAGSESVHPEPGVGAGDGQRVLARFDE